MCMDVNEGRGVWTEDRAQIGQVQRLNIEAEMKGPIRWPSDARGCQLGAGRCDDRLG